MRASLIAVAGGASLQVALSVGRTSVVSRASLVFLLLVLGRRCICSGTGSPVLAWLVVADCAGIGSFLVLLGCVGASPPAVLIIAFTFALTALGLLAGLRGVVWRALVVHFHFLVHANF